jgi:hypothetical protein
MRGQAAMEFVLIFVFAFILFIILVGVLASSTIGFSDRAPHEAELVLDVVALHVSALARLEPGDDVTIEFTVPNGTLANAQLKSDGIFLRIDRDGALLASRVISDLELLIAPIDVVGTRTLELDSGVITLG